MQNDWLYIGLFFVIGLLIPVSSLFDIVDRIAEEAQPD